MKWRHDYGQSTLAATQAWTTSESEEPFLARAGLRQGRRGHVSHAARPVVTGRLTTPWPSVSTPVVCGFFEAFV